MKNFALVAAVALLALAVPASAGETLETAPAATLEQQTEGPYTPIDLLPPPTLYCSQVHGYACPTVGAKRTCSDACGNTLSCTCVYYPSSGWKLWTCGIPC